MSRCRRRSKCYRWLNRVGFWRSGNRITAIAPHYLELGVNPEHLHRVVSISSGALDSLPHNGYVVTTIRAICKETHAAAYGPLLH